MGGQSEGRNHREEMAGTGEAMEQAEAGGSMDMPAVVALPTHMQMEVLMGGSVVVMAMEMGVQLQAKGCAHGEDPNHQQRNTDEEFSPGGHGLEMGKILEPNGDESENDHTGGMACAPCQGTAQCLDGSVERKGSHRHEVISTSDDVNGAGGNSSENADQHSSVVQRTKSAGAERLSR